eukprot:COSAG06_NODE_2029_length_7797_cov_803.230969_3_plen_878_part_00
MAAGGGGDAAPVGPMSAGEPEPEPEPEGELVGPWPQPELVPDLPPRMAGGALQEELLGSNASAMGAQLRLDPEVKVCTGCRKSRHTCLFSVTLLAIAVVDWAHLVTTMICMATLILSEGNDDPRNASAAGGDDLVPDDILTQTPQHVPEGIRDRALICFCMYCIKIVVYAIWVFWKLRSTQPDNGRRDLSSKWRHAQTWFVVMTYNTWMMVFVPLLVSVDHKGRNAFTLVYWQPDTDYVGRTRVNKGRWQQMTTHHGESMGVLDAFALTGSADLKWGPAFVMLSNAVCTAMAVLVNLESLNLDSDTDGVGTGWTVASLISITLHFAVALWMYVYPKLAKSHEGKTSKALFTFTIGILDTLNVAVLLIIALSLYHQREIPSAVCLVFIGSILTEVAAKAALASQLAKHLTRSTCSMYQIYVEGEPLRLTIPKQTYDKYLARINNVTVREARRIHPDNRFQEALHAERKPTSFLSCEPVAGQDMSTWTDSRQDLNQLGREQIIDMLLTEAQQRFDRESNAFAAATAGTWVMVPALCALEKPYSLKLLSFESDETPFCRTQYKFNLSTYGNALIVVVQLSRCATFAVWCYLMASGMTAEHGLFGYFDFYFPVFTLRLQVAWLILFTLVLYPAQMMLSFSFSFVWTKHWINRAREQSRMLVGAAAMLIFCGLDVVATGATGYYASCIVHNSTSEMFNCTHAFGDWIETEKDIKDYQALTSLASVFLVAFVVRVGFQAFAFSSRRICGGALPTCENHDRTECQECQECHNEKSETPSASLVLNGVFHGAFLLMALFPNDLPVYLRGQWSPLWPRPHWTNGVLQFLLLIEKTLMSYLITLGLLGATKVGAHRGDGIFLNSDGAAVWSVCISTNRPSTDGQSVC